MGGDFADSFKPAVYASTPSLLIGWLSVIPVIGWLIGIVLFIWTLVLLFLGVRELHEMETMRAVVAVVIAAVLYIIVIAIIAAILALIGYSNNDTIIVFDRVRETLQLHPNYTIEQAGNS